jgi:hypothetical protein
VDKGITVFAIPVKGQAFRASVNVYNTAIAGAGTVSANSPMVDRHTGAIGPSLKYDTAKYTVGTEYQYRSSSHYRSHNVGAVVRYKS